MTIRATRGFGGPEVQIDHPTPVIYNHSWTWAKGGQASCMVMEMDAGSFLTLTAHPSAQGFGPNHPDHEAAVGSIMTRMLVGLVADRVKHGYEIVSMDATSAVLKERVCHD